MSSSKCKNDDSDRQESLIILSEDILEVKIRQHLPKYVKKEHLAQKMQMWMDGKP